MPSLGDYFGSLLAEITNARLQADLESVRIAQLYASHPLLQHMPVPRFRLPSVTLDLPVAIEKIEAPSGGPAVDPAPIRKNLASIVDATLQQNRIDLTPSRPALDHRLDEVFNQLNAMVTKSPMAIAQASEKASGVVIEAMKATIAGDPSKILDPAVEASVRQQFGTEFAKLQPPPPRVQVFVVTAQLRDQGPAQNLTRIQLSVTEEGVEWTQTRVSDATSKTLLPE